MYTFFFCTMEQRTNNSNISDFCFVAKESFNNHKQGTIYKGMYK